MERIKLIAFIFVVFFIIARFLIWIEEVQETTREEQERKIETGEFRMYALRLRAEKAEQKKLRRQHRDALWATILKFTNLLN